MNLSVRSWNEAQRTRARQKEWLHENFVANTMEGYDAYVTDRNGNTTTYVRDWIERCRSNPTLIQVDTNPDIYDLVVSGIQGADKFGLSIQRNGAPFHIKGKLIDTLRIHGNGELILENCAIRDFIMMGSTARPVTLKNCMIGTMRLMSGSLTTFEWTGGSVDEIFAPPPSAASPFTGSVEVRNVRLAPVFTNAQAYRNLRHHLGALHNHEAASVFHAAEMQAEVRKQSYVDRTIGFFYRAISNYGGSSARPFAFFLSLLLANFVFLLATDGVTLLEDPKEADGWHHELYGAGAEAKLLRAGVFSLTQVLNPLGIFGTRLLLSGKTPAIALTSAILGLLSAISLALFVLAIRRRFRLDRSS